MTAAVHASLAETRARVAATEDRLARAVIAAAPDLLWQQSYMRADGFDAEGRAPVKTRPGDMIHHAPNQKHAIDMVPGPLPAMAFWKGAGLMANSGLNEGVA